MTYASAAFVGQATVPNPLQPGRGEPKIPIREHSSGRKCGSNRGADVTVDALFLSATAGNGAHEKVTAQRQPFPPTRHPRLAAVINTVLPVPALFRVQRGARLLPAAQSTNVAASATVSISFRFPSLSNHLCQHILMIFPQAGGISANPPAADVAW